MNDSSFGEIPFSQIYYQLEGREKEISQQVYNLRSNKKNSEFIDSLYKLSEDCYNYFDNSFGLEEENIDPGIIYINLLITLYRSEC